ncbi:MAG: efflux transporter outer membrane subunit [Rhodanobacteraceae bacterium]|jgi:NodT family efflux transporter outer membrane factor (OMF) lipoprotein|nr:efflux transporter outer membrane subunit [Rhodanobacteraceae bacterium]
MTEYRSRPRPALRPLALAATFVLAGCAVGPDFRTPPPPSAQAFTAEPLPATTAAADVPTGDAQRFLEGEGVPERWWTHFGSAELDRRVERALAHNSSVAAAQAALRQAQEGVRAARGALFPALDARAGALRENANAAGFGETGTSAPPFTLYNASVGVSYTLDLFGGVRRGIEAQQAQADLQRFQLEGTYLSLAANVTTTSVREAALREQIRATEEIEAIFREELGLIEQQHEIGAKSLADVLAARSALASTSAQLPPLRQALAQTQTQLAVYLGHFPAESEAAALELAALKLPTEVPLSLPSTVARQRPDIRVAESALHAAAAQVGVATANLYPQITLSGSLGTQALHADDLFGAGSKAWSVGVNLLQPLFHGGSLRAQKRAAEAGFDKAAADYRTTVLTAFQNIADSLHALELDAEGLKAQAAAEQAAARALALVRFQYKDGATGYLQVLDATRQYQLARIALIQARAARLADTAALYAALGGGWSEASRRDSNTIPTQPSP